jgi:hypothetical protein
MTKLLQMKDKEPKCYTQKKIKDQICNFGKIKNTNLFFEVIIRISVVI